MSDKQIYESFQIAKIKNTKQRTAILTILANVGKPLTVSDIYQEMQALKIDVNLSTIYRSLDIMSNKGLITKISNLQDNKAMYEVNQGIHHHYLYCIGCEKIITIEHCPLIDYENQLYISTGYKIIGHKLNVFGYCPSCQKKAKNDF